MRFRKSKKAGPFRFTLTPRGLSGTVGAGGLRMKMFGPGRKKRQSQAADGDGEGCLSSIFSCCLSIVFLFVLAAGGVAALSFVLGVDREDEAPSEARNLAEPSEGPDSGAAEIAGRVEMPEPPYVDFDAYTVESFDTGSFINCQVTFKRLPSHHQVAEDVVKAEAIKLVRANPDHDILVIAFDRDDKTLPDYFYGGDLYYDHSTGTLVPEDLRDGATLTHEVRGGYLARILFTQTLPGVTPHREWYSIELVFPSRPTDAEAREAAAAEVEKVKSEGRDIDFYFYRGELDNRITWRQLRRNRKYLAAHYVASADVLEPNWNWGEPQIASTPEPRTWRDKTAKFSVTATYVSHDAETVTIRREDNNKEVTVPIARLSEECRQYIESINSN